MDQLGLIIGFVAILGVIILVNVMVNKANKQKRYEAKVKAGFIKDGEEIPMETAEEKKAKMEAAMNLASKGRNSGKKD